jgi:hypothetical protein
LIGHQLAAGVDGQRDLSAGLILEQVAPTLETYLRDVSDWTLGGAAKRDGLDDGAP